MPHREVFLWKVCKLVLEDLDRDAEYKTVRNIGALA
jgi:hypothetical protein